MPDAGGAAAQCLQRRGGKSLLEFPDIGLPWRLLLLPERAKGG